MKINRLMADGHFGADLFSTPFTLQIALNRQPIRLFYLAGVAAVKRSILRQQAGLSGKISS
jgi:hypothetical protein